MRSERMIERTATGSGGATIAPSVIAAAHVNDGCSPCATTATAAVETSTMTTERRTIGPIWRRISRRGKLIDPAYNNGGINTRNRTSGGSVCVPPLVAATQDAQNHQSLGDQAQYRGDGEEK